MSGALIKEFFYYFKDFRVKSGGKKMPTLGTTFYHFKFDTNFVDNLWLFIP